MLERIGNRYLRRAVGGLIAVVAVTAAWYLLSRALSPGRAVRLCEGESGSRSEFSGRLRIGAYNIAHGRGTGKSNWAPDSPQRLAAIGRLLAGEELDLVVLNEVDFDSVWSGRVDMAGVIAREAGFPYWIEQRNVDAALPGATFRFGNAVLSRFPLSEPVRIDLPGYSWTEGLFAGRKRALSCLVGLGGGRSVRLVAVHLEHRSERVRLLGAKRLARVAAESTVPVVLAGDLNSTPVGFPAAQPDEGGRTAVSHLLSTGIWRTLPEKEPSGKDFTFPSGDPRMVIDWVLVPAEWRVISKKVTGGDLSDHLAVVMEVEATTGAEQ